MSHSSDHHSSEGLPETLQHQHLANIGRYEVLKILGTGGMGTVYKAFDPQLQRTVAVKVPHFDRPQQLQDVQEKRFTREARALAAIRHPHVCPIYDVGEHDGHPFVVMAFIEGNTLGDLLSQPIPTPIVAARFIPILLQILEALEEIHAHGIIHRDLKPTNILLDPADRAFVTDFGLAHSTGQSEALTSEGVVVGTPTYMAPEQALGHVQDIGPWTDIYAVGMILYRIVTGRVPFEGSAVAVLAKIAHESPPPPSTLRSGVDRRLETIIQKALARNPQDRYQSARELGQALADWRADSPSQTNSHQVLTENSTLEMRSSMPAAAELPARPRAPGQTARLSFLLHQRPANLIRRFRQWSLSRKLLAVALLAIGIIGTIAVFQWAFPGLTRSDVPRNPFVTRETYMNIKPGMTTWDVNELLGAGEIVSEEGLIVDAGGNYRKWDARRLETGRGPAPDTPIRKIQQEFVWRNGERAIYVVFLNDQVIAKSEEGLYRR